MTTSEFDEIFQKTIPKYPQESMQNFMLIFSVVSEVDAFKETYRGAILSFFCECMIFPRF